AGSRPRDHRLGSVQAPPHRDLAGGESCAHTVDHARRRLRGGGSLMPRARILPPDEIDVLELLLSGILTSPPPEMGNPAGEELTLADAENTPVAVQSADGSLRPRKPLALPAGRLADPQVRMTAPRTAEPGAIAL